MTQRRDATVHATCVRLDAAGKVFGASPGAGVLLLGRSGAGKSDLALRLIARGAKLVSDDRTALGADRGRLIGRPPASIRGLMEVRHVGIVAVPYAAKARIVLAVRLENPGGRLPEPAVYPAPFDLSAPVPLIRLAPFEVSAAEKVLLAAAAFERNLFRNGAGVRSR